MILQVETRPACPHADDGEGLQRQLSLLRCLRRMGFYDPESLLGLRREALDPLALDDGSEPPEHGAEA